VNAFYEHHKNNIRFHYRCFDRILLNGTIQPFQQEQRVVGFFGEYRNLYPVSRDVLRDIATQFHNWVKNRSQQRQAAILEEPQGRRDEFVDAYFKQAKADTVVCIIKAREPARILTAIGTKADNRWHLELKQRWVEQYNFYINDSDWGRWIRRLSCAQLPSNALEKLVDDHARGSANHTLSDAGNRAAGGDIARIVKQRAGVIGGQLNRSFALYKSRCAAAFDRHLVLQSGLKIVQTDGSAENAADRPEAHAHFHLVGILASLDQLLTARKAFGNSIRVCEKTPDRQRCDSIEREFPLNFHVLGGASNRRFQTAARESASQIEPIIGRSVNVVQSDDAITGVLAGLLQHVRRWLFALQFGFGFRGAECMIGDAGDTDCDVRQCPRSVELDQGSGTADRKTGSFLCYLQVSAPGFSTFHGELNLAHDLIPIEGRGEHINE